MSRHPWSIRDRGTFDALYRSGRRVKNGPITVTYVDAGPQLVPRVAYAVGRKVGGAVQRNRLRRQLRAIVQEVSRDLPPGAYLVAAGPPAARLPHSELRTVVHQSLRTATGRGH